MDWRSLSLPSLVEPIIKEAGKLVCSYFGKGIESIEKDSGGIVTKADSESEDYIIGKLKDIIPDASILGEESGVHDNKSDFCWVIDPLDGTTNFARGLPYFCISIALTYKDIPVFGAVYQPLTDEYFYAQKESGAFLNGSQIKVSSVADIERSIPVVGFPHKKGAIFDGMCEVIDEFAPRTYSFRHFGAVALDQAYVAAGRLDAVILADLGWWDVAAGMLLITEAGGCVSSFDGSPVGPDFETFLAAGPVLHKCMSTLLNMKKG